jgi:hypothetical protein
MGAGLGYRLLLDEDADRGQVAEVDGAAVP